MQISNFIDKLTSLYYAIAYIKMQIETYFVIKERWRNSLIIN